MAGERFEALCTIDVDGEEATRGIVTSVPDLSAQRCMPVSRGDFLGVFHNSPPHLGFSSSSHTK